MRLPNYNLLNTLFLVFFSVFFGLTAAFAQNALEERETLHDAMEQIGAFKKKFYSFELKEGEEVVVNLESIDGKKLRRFQIDQPGTPFSLVAKKVRRIERKSFVAQRDGNYTFTLKNRGLLKRNIRLKIDKYPKVGYKDTIILEDIVMTYSYDTSRSIGIDTIPIFDIIEKDFVLEPSLNYKSKDTTCICEILDTSTDYQYAAYWIGIGTEAVKKYETLKQDPPRHWIHKNIPIAEPIMAYGLKLTNDLPGSSTSLFRNVRFALVSPSEAAPILARDGDNKRLYNIYPVYKAGRDQKIKICFKNFNTSSKVPISVRIAIYQLARKEKTKILKHERVQEIFIKKPVARTVEE